MIPRVNDGFLKLVPSFETVEKILQYDHSNDITLHCFSAFHKNEIWKLCRRVRL